jgi:hypothetical protein
MAVALEDVSRTAMGYVFKVIPLGSTRIRRDNYGVLIVKILADVSEHRGFGIELLCDFVSMRRSD